MRGPLGATSERLRALQPAYEHFYAVDPAPVPALAWQPLADALPSCLTAAAESASRSYGGARVGGTLAHSVLGRVTAALVLEHRAWDVGPGDLLVVLDDTGYAERVAPRRPTVAVLPGDPQAAAPDTVVVGDLEVLVDRVAEQAVGTLAPLFAFVRAQTRFGLVPLWNLAADAVLSTATFLPLVAGGTVDDQERGRTLGVALVTALARHGARLRCRARVQVVTWRRREVAVPVRGSCCLVYRTVPGATPEGEGYCLTCPVVSDRLRAERYPAQLDVLLEPPRAARRVWVWPPRRSREQRA